MDMETGLIIGSGLASLASVAVKSVGCWGKSKQKKWNKVNIASIVMSKKTGKSSLARNLKGHSKLLLVDVSECVDTENNNKSDADYLIKSKEYVDNLKSKLKDYKLVLLCSTIDEAKYYGVPEDNICVITPSNTLFDNICLTVKDPAVIEEMKTKRLELISGTDRDLLNIFKDYDSLYNTIISSFKLQNKF